MNDFNYQSELQKIVDSKQLIEIRFHSSPGLFNVAYILDANVNYITLAEIDPKANLDGVCMYKMSDVCSIKLETGYLSKWGKKIKNDAHYQQAVRDIEKLKEFTFDGFINAFENSDTFVEIVAVEKDTLAGRIIGHDNKVIVLDEIDQKNNGQFARAYIHKAFIYRLSVDIAWVNKAARSYYIKN